MIPKRKAIAVLFWDTPGFCTKDFSADVNEAEKNVRLKYVCASAFDF